jgi:ABC-type antimicrobial peptide transport system permease subunit
MRTPGLALALLFSIAIGIGSNAVVYGFVQGLIASATSGSAHEPEQAADGAVTPEVVEGLARVGTLLRIAAAAVFFAACANVAAFLLARASARSRETSVRVALGASRPRLASQLLADSVVIAVAGAAAGLLLARWTSNILPALFFSQDAEQLVFAPDLVAIATSSAAGVLITIACGLLPMFEMRHDRPATVLQRESAGPSRMMRRLRAGLVVAQMTCCCVLVISTGLLFQGFRSALQTGTGHRLRHAILATLHVRPDSSSRHEALEIGLAYFREAERRAGAVAGVTSTAWAATLPGGAPMLQPLRIEQAHAPLVDITMAVAALTPASLDLISIPPVAGRLFGGEDTAASCRVGVVNQAAAETLFDGQAIGRAIEDLEGQRIEIVGVVAMRQPAQGETDHPTLFYYPNQGSTPLDETGRGRFRIPASTPATEVLEANVVSRGFFEQMGMQPSAGTLFQDRPPAGGCSVGVVNTEAAERYFGGKAVGAAVIDANGRRTEIVGVVESPQLLSLQRGVEPTVYFSMAQTLLPRMALLVSAVQADRATVTTVRHRLDSVPGAFRRPAVTTLYEHLSMTALAPLRIATTLIGASAVMALALGALGLYGAMAEASRQRRRETALRIALGSQAWRVRRDVLVDGARLAGAGAVAGMLGALAVGRLLASISPPGDAVTLWAWLSAPLVLLVVVAIAGLLPARRALMGNPLQVMRGDQ